MEWINGVVWVRRESVGAELVALPMETMLDPAAWYRSYGLANGPEPSKSGGETYIPAVTTWNTAKTVTPAEPTGVAGVTLKTSSEPSNRSDGFPLSPVVL
jgi:hypothetical protein